MVAIHYAQRAFPNRQFDFRNGSDDIGFHLRYYSIRKNDLFIIFRVRLSVCFIVSLLNSLLLFIFCWPYIARCEICRTKHNAGGVILARDRSYILKLFIMDGLSFAEEKAFPSRPDSRCNFLCYMRVDSKVLCVRFNHFMKSAFWKAGTFNHFLALLEEDFLLLTVGSGFRNGSHQFTILARLAQLMPHFCSRTHKLIVDDTILLELLIQIVLLVETYIKRQCQYKWWRAILTPESHKVTLLSFFAVLHSVES